jgi:NADPH:quinone reductase-like Zn-dependent oxidoreductase
MARRGGLNSSYPFVMGMDFAGVVQGVPTGERGLRIGDRIFVMARTNGANCEYAAVAPGVKTEPVALEKQHRHLLKGEV